MKRTDKIKIPILDFIKEVRSLGHPLRPLIEDHAKELDESSQHIRAIINHYTQGMCYWFAKILEDAYPGGTILVVMHRGHIVYEYAGHFYDIRGEFVDKRAKMVPIEYFGDFIDDFKHCYKGGEATRKDITDAYKKAKADGMVYTYKHTENWEKQWLAMRSMNAVYGITREDYIHERAAKFAESYDDIITPECLKDKVKSNYGKAIH